MHFRMILCVVLASTVGLGAQDPSKQIETRHLQIATATSEASVAPGGRLSLLIDVTPKTKMHVYAPGQKDYIPVSLTLDANPAVKSSPARFPKGEKLFLEALGETQLVYSKPFRIVQEVIVAPGAGATLAVKGTLRYQACDDKICYVPVNVPLAWSISVR